MTRSQIVEGALFAALASLATLAVLLITPAHSPAPTSLLAVLIACYLLFLTSRLGWPPGSLTVTTATATLTALATQLPSALAALFAISLLLSVGRCFVLARSVWGFVADSCLGLLATTATVFVLVQTGSLPLTVWCYFLIQSFHCAIANRSAAQMQRAPDAFGAALQSASRALDRRNSRVTNGDIL